MDARRKDEAPGWLFGVAGVVTLVAIVGIAQLSLMGRRGQERGTSRYVLAERVTLGPAPVAEPAYAVAATSPPIEPTELPEPAPVSLESLVEATLGFEQPALTLTFPLASLPNDGGYDPVANLAPIDLLKPAGLLPSPELDQATPDLANFDLSAFELEFGASDLIVLAPAAPRWTAESHGNRWKVFGFGGDAALNRVGELLAAASNNGPRRVADVVDATRKLAWRPAPRLAESVIHSPPALAGPKVESSSERLAMAAGPKVEVESPVIPLTDRERPTGDELIATPETLLEQVRLLIEEPATSAWAMRVEATLDQMLTVRPGDVESFTRVSRELRRLALEGSDLAEIVDTRRTAVLLRRACYGIFRRITAWDLTVRLEARHRVEVARPFADGYQRPDDTRWWLASGPLFQPLVGSRRLADPLASWSLDPPRLAMRRLRVAELSSAVRPTSMRGANARRLVSRLEAYETTRSPRLANAIADELGRLRDTANEDERQLVSEVDGQYRNANLRITVSDELLARLLPASTQETMRVRDRVLGAEVHGRASTSTKLQTRLTPDDTRWRVRLEASGTVTTDSAASTGPVVVRSRGVTQFVAHKPIELHYDGLRLAAASCQAQNQTKLMGVDTRFDAVPIVRGVLRNRVRDGFYESQAKVRRRAARQVEQRVARTLDAKAGEAVDALRRQYSLQVLDRAERLGLDVDPIEVRTTETQLIARLRLASEGQLGSHTPRNRPPSDSLASLQLHESAINNAAEGLRLAGRRFTPQALREHLADRLNSPMLSEGQIESPGTEFVFADEQPLSVRLGDGQARVVLALAEMRLGRKRYRDFKVHASYHPEPVGATAALRRRGAIEIEGRMKTASRLRLHGVFGKVLSDERPITLIAPPADDERFDDLMITQMVMDDGWLGLALGPTEQPGVPGERVAIAGHYVR